MDSDKIKILRLVTGEEIIGIVESNGSDVIISSPHFIRMQSQNGGQPQVILFPVLQMGDENIKDLPIPAAHVLYAYNPHADILSQFNSKFGSGLFIPAFKGLLQE